MPATPSNETFVERIRGVWQRASIGRRATGIIVALLLEAGLILLLLTLSTGSEEVKPIGRPVVTTFDASPDEPETPDSPEPEQEEQPVPEPEPVTQPPPEPEVRPPEPAPIQRPVVSPPTAIIPVPRNQVPPASQPAAPPAPPAPPAAAPARPSQQTYGPPNTPRSGGPDSQRVGTAPDGKPLYRAEWYREPTPQELAGYLSTARSPSVGIMACKTVADFRVENCVLESETPAGSNIGRAILASAWQLQVRPPRVGGRMLYGEWVRIRISYN